MHASLGQVIQNEKAKAAFLEELSTALRILLGDDFKFVIKDIRPGSIVVSLVVPDTESLFELQ